MPVSFLATKTPSNVSTNASAIRKFFDTNVMMVELSLRINSTVVNAASGPFTKNSTETKFNVSFAYSQSFCLEFADAYLVVCR